MKKIVDLLKEQDEINSKLRARFEQRMTGNIKSNMATVNSNMQSSEGLANERLLTRRFLSLSEEIQEACNMAAIWIKQLESDRRELLESAVNGETDSNSFRLRDVTNHMNELNERLRMVEV